MTTTNPFGTYTKAEAARIFAGFDAQLAQTKAASAKAAFAKLSTPAKVAQVAEANGWTSARRSCTSISYRRRSRYIRVSYSVRGAIISAVTRDRYIYGAGKLDRVLAYLTEEAGRSMSNTITAAQPLNPTDLLALADVVNHMFAHGKVRLLLESGNILEGTLRHYCGKEVNEPKLEGGDVRDWYVRITSVTGAEYSVPLAELAAKHQRGECAGPVSIKS